MVRNPQNVQSASLQQFKYEKFYEIPQNELTIHNNITLVMTIPHDVETTFKPWTWDLIKKFLTLGIPTSERGDEANHEHEI